MAEQTPTTLSGAMARQAPPPSNIPVQLTELIGREQDVRDARHLLSRSEVRLLTMTGPGGVGKTRLALKVALDVLWDYEGGVFFIDLAPLTDPAHVLATIADTLNIKESGEMPLHVELNDRLGGERTLLILDNFEQLLDAATSLVGLLQECPHLKLLVTSRVALRVSGEFEYQVVPLALPTRGQPIDLEVASQAPAVSLFVKRASAIQQGFHLTTENASVVADICTRLDGLPLALELAAAHIKTLPPSSMLKRLVKRLPLLVGGARDLPMRHRTLRGTMDWSYGLLTAHERRTFRALSVFVGGLTFEAAQETAGQGDPVFIETLRALVDASLLRQSGDTTGEVEPRYTMLETVREYGLEQLETMGETTEARNSHAQYFLAMAERAEPMLTGSEQATWLERLDADHDNLRAALSWLIESGSGEQALRLAGSLWRFWYMRGFLSDGRRWLSSVPLNNTGMPPGARAMALNGSGVLAYAQGDVAAARAWFEQALAIRRELGDKNGISIALNNLGAVAVAQTDYARAIAFHEESLAIRRELGDKYGMASSLSNLGGALTTQGDYDRAMIYLEESLSLRRELGDLWGAAISLTNMGGVAAYRGDPAQSIALHSEALKIRQEIGDKPGIAVSLNNLGRAVLAQGDHAKAKELLENAFALRLSLGDDVGMVDTLEGMAGVALAEGHPLRATRLWGSVEALRESIGAPRTPADMPSYNSALAFLHAAVGEARFESAWSEGRGLTPAEAVTASDDEPILLRSHNISPHRTAQPTTRSTATTNPGGLTEREIDVLRAVSYGLTNSQVAEKLIISPLTVNVHLRSIYSKLNVQSRTAAVRFATDHKLI